jgi:hypothetical protein
MRVHDLIGSFSVVPGGEREKLWQKVLSGSFAMVGSQIGKGKCTSILSEFPCEWSHRSCPGNQMWKALLGACRIPGNVKMPGEHVAK